MAAALLAVLLAALSAALLLARPPVHLPLPARPLIGAAPSRAPRATDSGGVVTGAATPGGAARGLGTAAAERSARSVRLAAVLAGCGAAAVVGGPVGPVVGLVVAGVALALGPRALAGLDTAERRAQREQLTADLPLALDLLGACLAGGAGLAQAAEAVGGALGGPVGARVARVAGALSVGTAPDEAWAALAVDDEDPLAPVARALARAARGGAPVGPAVARLAADARRAARARSERAARQVGVLAVAPLGLCFLPAFVLVGVVPVVAGLVAPLLASF